MLVNLSDVLTSEGMEMAREISLEMTCYDNGTESFEIASKSPISLTVTNAGEDKAVLRGCADISFRGACDRCLTEVPVALKLDFERTILSPEAWGEEADDFGFMDGFSLDVETLVHDEILLNWPAKILCKDDCKGICPVCGQNLNERECGCDTFVPDPRMAVIQDIFKKNKEV
ncbi:YceD family protein [Acetatifactor aquisgranensis]|uniref:YceD family protein n=1 Tax=Acetatifactor aquisgranensis TaxID=2941233 RepID=UPI00203D4CAD|nr:DUF177 domain-containing protein [Acetatifactor aquisgranensis]MCI8542467.1 DUF177 domain-containing protein [Lachnospiraceae bacterium]